MYWMIPAAGAALGAIMGAEQQKADREARRVDAIANMYAPLFGKAPTSLGAQKDRVTPGALAGAMSGFGIASQLGGGGGASAAAANSADPNTSAWVPYWQTANQSHGAPAGTGVYDYYFGGQNPYSIGG